MVEQLAEQSKKNKEKSRGEDDVTCCMGFVWLCCGVVCGRLFVLGHHAMKAAC